jgi:hypothetical protein
MALYRCSLRAGMFAQFDCRFGGGAAQVERRDLNRCKRKSNPRLKKIVVYFSTTTTFFS